MVVYIATLVCSYLLLFYSKKVNDQKLKKIFIFLSFFILFVVSSIRYGVGTDYFNYVAWFKWTDISMLSLNNFGFDLMIIIIKFFTENSQFMFAICSLITLIFVYKSVISNQEDYDLSIFLFVTLSYYFSSLNSIRQWIATAIIMFSLKYVFTKDFWKFFIFVLIASLFHASALISIIIYFIFNLKIKKYIRIIILLISIIIFKLIDITSILINLMQMFFPGYYDKYILSGYDLFAVRGSMFPVLLNFIMLIYYLFFETRILNVLGEKKYNFRLNISTFLCVMSLMNSVNELFSRVAMYFLPYIIFLIPDTLKIWKPKVKIVFTILLLVGAMSFFIFNTVSKNSNNVLPYKTVFNIKLR